MTGKTYRVNYKSDFVLTLTSDAGWAVPFRIKFWTSAPKQAYFAGWDGQTWTHCAYDPAEPTKLKVQFDNHRLTVGELRYEISYHFEMADFPDDTEDEVLNRGSVVAEVDGMACQVVLDFNGETAPDIQFALPAYANELQRIANEEQRIANEEQRIANEEARIAAETIRQQNEAQRISNEESRVTEFARLKQESETATSDANAAATLANEKAALADDKAALADAAATLANEKAQLAADKAALAQAAATLANEKAALAQQKAAYAQTQGDYAKAQGDYAKEQGEIAEEDHERAEADHTRAESDHTQATSDHTQAGTDHSTAVNDHTQSVTDHTQADTDHTRAESDHTQAASDHTQAGADHTRAESDHTTASADHTQAGQDHTRAESDHTRAESDHAAVEVYVDSLGAFDISAYHATGGVLAKYADLTAALGTNGANIPEAIRKGGMSVKFVLSSDNKYVQYRYMETDATTAATFTNVANWQGVDDEPTAGSDNLVKSGGVFNNLGNLEKDVIGTITIDYTYDSTSLNGGYNTGLHRWEKHLTSWGYYSKLIPVSSGKKYTITPESGANTSWAFVTAAPQNLQDLSFASGQIYHLNETEETSISTPEDAVYLVVTYNTNSSENLKLPIITYVPKVHISLADATKAIDDIQETVGNVRTQDYGSRYDNLNGALTQNSIAAFTVANSECDSDGYISAIRITTNASGTLTFMVGLLDQRRNAVNTRTFDVTIPNAGVNNIELDTPVYIRAGEQLFVFTDANIPTLKYEKGSTSTDADVQVMVSGGGYPGGGYDNYMTYYEQSPTGFPYGVVVDFNYTVKSLHNSLFEEKADADITKEQVKSLSNAVQSAGIVYDNLGLPYRIIVVNNQLVPKSLVYKKVVALGNSLTAHEDYPSIGWTSGGDYSMASTRIEVSWTRQLQKILRTINGNSTAIVTPYSIYAWEKNPAIEPANIADSHGTYLSDVLTQDVDCVIFRAGENNASATQTQTDYENGLTSLVNYIKQLCPTADIVITSLMWPNTLKDAAFYNVANTMGLRYVNSASVGSNKEALGDYCLNVDNTTYFPIINSGVAGHVNDYGFYLFANILANSFGLTPLEEVYDIEVQSNVEYYVNRTKGVYQGLITIQTFGNNQPTINVVDSNSTPISVNHFDMSGVSLPSSMANKPTWCSVFEMPNSDVTITIGDI